MMMEILLQSIGIFLFSTVDVKVERQLGYLRNAADWKKETRGFPSLSHDRFGFVYLMMV
jgi:hypothetical protein